MSRQLENLLVLPGSRLVCILLVVALVVAAAPGTDYKIDRDLLNELADDEGATAAFFVVFGERPDLSRAYQMSDRATRGRFVAEALQATATRSQRGVRGYLRGRRADFTPFWIENKIYVPNGTLTLARALARRPEVVAVLPEIIYTIPQPGISGDAGTQGIGWNISRINADLVWGAYGTKGAGAVVANIDTGVQYDHPAVASQYRGKTTSGYNHVNNWYDPTGHCGATPCDNKGHGTHTMGTMVGDDGGSNRVGVAPEAKWIACKGCRTNQCSGSHLIACAQWIAARLPDVVNNSWGGGSGNSWYRSYVQNWRAAGIFPAFSAGNGGPNCGTAGSPGDYVESFGSGATSSTDTIASFSARGPSAFGGIKPNVSAPGVSVRSSLPTNSYGHYSGTSMASPHTAAAAALLWAVNPAYRGNIGDTEQILESSAVPLTTTQSCGGVSGAAIPNNTYGHGLIDVKAAADSLGSAPNQPPVVTILSPANGSAHDCGVPVNFSGSAPDPEDGDLPASMVWTDNGASLGTGSPLSKTYLCTDTGNHNIVAVATDSKGASGSDTITISIVDPSIPAAPTELRARAKGSLVTLTWKHDGANVTGFRVEQKKKLKKNNWDDWGQVATPGPGARSHQDSPGSGRFQYRVFALNGSNVSAPSNTASARVK
jgi:hypothetical protein